VLVAIAGGFYQVLLCSSHRAFLFLIPAKRGIPAIS
jgi:hypothetical protein